MPMSDPDNWRRCEFCGHRSQEKRCDYCQDLQEVTDDWLFDTEEKCN